VLLLLAVKQSLSWQCAIILSIHYTAFEPLMRAYQNEKCNKLSWSEHCQKISGQIIELSNFCAYFLQVNVKYLVTYYLKTKRIS